MGGITDYTQQAKTRCHRYSCLFYKFFSTATGVMATPLLHSYSRFMDMANSSWGDCFSLKDVNISALRVKFSAESSTCSCLYTHRPPGADAAGVPIVEAPSLSGTAAAPAVTGEARGQGEIVSAVEQ